MNEILKKLFFFLSVFVIFNILLMNPSVSFADRMKDIKKELINKKAAHKKLSRKSYKIHKEMSSLKKNLISISKNIQKSEYSLIKTEKHLKDLKNKKITYIENIYRDNQAMGGFIAAAKKYSSTPAISILAQDDPIKAARAFTIIKAVMPNIQKQSAYLKAQLREIQKIEANIKKQLKIKISQNKRYNKEEKKLRVLLTERENIYKKTEARRSVDEKAMAKLVKESRSIEDLMKNLKSKAKHSSVEIANYSLAANKFPVKGRIYTAFGKRNELGAISKGISFITRSKAKIIIPMAGTVKFAGPFQHYKNLLIVEHAGGYHSLITGMSKINTVVGAHLLSGEPVGIAKAINAPKIYYELRHNGKPINPKKLLLAQNK